MIHFQPAYNGQWGVDELRARGTSFCAGVFVWPAFQVFKLCEAEGWNILEDPLELFFFCDGKLLGLWKGWMFVEFLVKILAACQNTLAALVET